MAEEIIKLMGKSLETSKAIFSLVQQLKKEIDEQRDVIIDHETRILELERQLKGSFDHQ